MCVCVCVCVCVNFLQKNPKTQLPHRFLSKSPAVLALHMEEREGGSDPSGIKRAEKMIFFFLVIYFFLMSFLGE